MFGIVIIILEGILWTFDLNYNDNTLLDFEQTIVYKFLIKLFHILHSSQRFVVGSHKVGSMNPGCYPRYSQLY